MAFYFESEWEGELFPDCENVLSQVIEKACDYVRCPYECSVNMLLTDNTAIRSMNKEFRGIDRETDVLSFPMVDYKEPGNFDGLEDHTEEYFEPDSGELLLGDIVISVEKAIEQAVSYGHSLKREMAFLTAHSMLHLFGYDHVDDTEREEMERMQEEILRELGIGRDAE